MSNTTLGEITTIFRDVLDDEDINLELTTTAEDIEDWDSLVHIQLIVAIEKKFGLQFKAQEIENFNKVGDMVELIERKAAS